MDSNSEIQGYNVYPMLHFRRKFSSGITPDQPSLRPRCLCLPLRLHLPPLLRPLRLNSEQGKNSSLPPTSPVNGAPDEPSSTPALCICIWPQSSSPATRKKSFGPLPSSRTNVLRSGPRTSFARRRTLAFFQFNPGSTSNNNSRVNSFRSMQKRMPSTLWKGLRTIKGTGRWTITWIAS